MRFDLDRYNLPSVIALNRRPTRSGPKMEGMAGARPIRHAHGPERGRARRMARFQG